VCATFKNVWTTISSRWTGMSKSFLSQLAKEQMFVLLLLVYLACIFTVSTGLLVLFSQTA